jgi:hypothetical protein
LVLYLDTAQDRVNEDADRAFTEAVEAVRMGTGFARDTRAYHRWANRPKRNRHVKSLSPAALESAVMNIAKMFPDNVIVVQP